MYKPITMMIGVIALLMSGAVMAEDFQDDFNDAALSDQWEVINPNEDSMIIEEGSLQILTDTAKDGYFNPTNFVLFKQELKGEYEITLKMKFSRSDSNSSWGNNQNAGLMLYKDKANGIVFAASNAWGASWNTDAVHFSKMRKGAWIPDYQGKFKGAVKEREISLRIQRIKRKFIASFLNDKGEWRTIGEYTELRPGYRVGIFASRGGNAHEDLEKFDSFSLKAIK